MTRNRLDHNEERASNVERRDSRGVMMGVSRYVIIHHGVTHVERREQRLPRRRRERRQPEPGERAVDAVERVLREEHDLMASSASSVSSSHGGSDL